MDDVAAFLARHTPLSVETETWGSPGVPIPLRLAWYRSDEEPPAALVTSVRAIVFRAGEVLTLREPGGRPYVVPGGRREAGESHEATLRREILEETGWILAAIRPLGFVHLRNLGPEPPGNPYPYPDAFQLVRVADAATYTPDAIIPDEWVASSAFLPAPAALALPLRPGERALLAAALGSL
jgi:8-oxo-dGTP pyrophosphatase MutT (NUDIX family)